MVTRRRRARGMTLIEVMIALLVTTVALLGALATVGMTVRGATFSRNATEASVLAQSKLEQMVSIQAANVTLTIPADNSISTDNCIDAYGNAPPSGTCTSAYPYTRTAVWTTTKSPDALRRIITVTVTWYDGLGKPHSVIAARQKDPQ